MSTPTERSSRCTGWAIARRIRQMCGEVLQVGQSALYLALRNLERNGWITSEWKTSGTKPSREYYTLTRSGRKAVAAEAVNWERLSAATSAIVRRDLTARNPWRAG